MPCKCGSVYIKKIGKDNFQFLFLKVCGIFFFDYKNTVK